MSIYRRPLRSDELMHASHKYKDKVRTKNGNWRYIYDDTYNTDYTKEYLTFPGEDKKLKVRKQRDVQKRYKDNATEDRQERNYRGDVGIQRHNDGLFVRDVVKDNKKAYNDYLENKGYDSRRNRAAKAYKARQEQAAKREAAKRSSSPIHKTISTAQNAINKGKNLFKKLFG